MAARRATMGAQPSAVNYTRAILAILPPGTGGPFLWTVNYGLLGNAATAGGGFRRALAWSVGALMGLIVKRHDFTFVGATAV